MLHMLTFRVSRIMRCLWSSVQPGLPSHRRGTISWSWSSVPHHTQWTRCGRKEYVLLLKNPHRFHPEQELLPSDQIGSEFDRIDLMFHNYLYFQHSVSYNFHPHYNTSLIKIHTIKSRLRRFTLITFDCSSIVVMVIYDCESCWSSEVNIPTHAIQIKLMYSNIM